MSRIRKGDRVIVLTGKDKGKQGGVLRVVNPDRVVVEGVNRVKRHQRGNPNKGSTGGIVDKEMSIAASNVALHNPVSKRAERVGSRRLEDGRKVRYYKSNNEIVDA
jgi:large subunit ribosomal protein L24